MGSENFISVVGGGCGGESKIGQDNTMHTLNLDWINNSKNVNNSSSSSRQCIICLSNVCTTNYDKDDGISAKDNQDVNEKAKQEFEVDSTETETGNGAGTDFKFGDINDEGVDADEASLLKLLNVKVQIPFPSQTQRKNVKSTSQSVSCSYCSSCTSRNKEISSLFSQMDELRRKLTGLKDGIELDLLNSVKRTMNTDSSYSGCMNPEDIVDRNEFLRYHIVKSLDFSVIELFEEVEPLDSDPAALHLDLVDLRDGFEVNNAILIKKDASNEDTKSPVLNIFQDRQPFGLPFIRKDLEIAALDGALPSNYNPQHSTLLSSDAQHHPTLSSATSYQHLFKCTHCDKTFNQRVNLHNHERIHKLEKPFTCPTCSMIFTKRSQLQNHERTHTGTKPFECQTCHKKFTHGGQLRSHVRVHSGEKPFKCPHCFPRFTQSGNRDTHVARHHPN